MCFLLLGKPTEDTATSPTTPNSSVVGHSLKSSEETNVYNHWLELYYEREEPVTLTEIIRGRPGGKGK
jgi:hypothetical protein